MTVANLITAARAASPLRGWWLAAGLAAAADRAFTFGYFIPTMIGLMRAGDSPQAVTTAVRWSSLNHVRLAIGAVAFLASLRAFALFYGQQ